MKHRHKKGARVQRKKLKDLEAEIMPTMTNRDLHQAIVKDLYNRYVLELVNRLVDNGQMDLEDGFIIKQVDKFVRRNKFHNRYLNEAIKRFRRKMKIPVVLVYDVDELTEGNLLNKESDAEAPYAYWLKEV